MEVLGHHTTSVDNGMYEIPCGKITALNYFKRKRKILPIKIYIHQKIYADRTRLSETIYEIAVASDCSHEALAGLADQLQQSFTIPLQNATPTEIPDVCEIKHLLQDISPRFFSVGQIMATLKHLNLRNSFV